MLAFTERSLKRQVVRTDINKVHTTTVKQNPHCGIMFLYMQIFRPLCYFMSWCESFQVTRLSSSINCDGFPGSENYTPTDKRLFQGLHSDESQPSVIFDNMQYVWQIPDIFPSCLDASVGKVVSAKTRQMTHFLEPGDVPREKKKTKHINACFDREFGISS